MSTAAQAQLANPSLFRVSGPSGDSFLLGTIHVGVDLSEFPVDVRNLIQKSRVVLPELDMTDEELSLYQTDPFRALAKHNPFFRANLDVQTKARLMQLGFPDYIVTTLGDSDCGVLAPLVEIRAGKIPMDLQVLQIAHANHLPVQALDTNQLREQARAGQDQAQGACSLKQIFSYYTDAQILASLEASDSAEINSYRRGDPIPNDELNSPLATIRNRAWIPAVETEVKLGRAFIAVGQVHLFGSQGLIQLLVQKGYTVTQMNGSRARAAGEAVH